MLAKRAALALLAGRALIALASPVEPLFTVQDFTAHVTQDHVCGDRESAVQLESAPSGPGPEVHLDEAVFTGLRKGQTDQFLGIPFAKPP
jgi:hypothetical protein